MYNILNIWPTAKYRSGICELNGKEKRGMNAMNRDLLNEYPRPDEASVDRLLAEEIHSFMGKIIVLDDDPTGTQTVHGVSVYTRWDYSSIREGFEEPGALFYILTNSRALSAAESAALHEEAARTIHRVSKETGTSYLIISRSDSTLRGHYPLETEVLKNTYEECTGHAIDGEVLCPFFKEGGRFTVGNIHYVLSGKELIPAAKTEFARDSTFGYASSDLRQYVEEKTEGRYPAGSVICIPMNLLRSADTNGVESLLLSASDFQKIIVNASDYCDLKVFCTALYRAMKKGKRFMFRSAASFVKVIAGIPDRPLLGRGELSRSHSRYGGLILIGSYTEKTTAQLSMLKGLDGIELLEFDSDLITDLEALETERQRILALASACIQKGRHAVIYTKRKKLIFDNDTKETVLKRSVSISDALQSFAVQIGTAPSFLIAKGGITSSDIATKALHIRRAVVLGQVAPGIPAWETGPDSRYPGIPYIIFPGNVGEADTLKHVISFFCS